MEALHSLELATPVLAKALSKCGGCRRKSHLRRKAALLAMAVEVILFLCARWCVLVAILEAVPTGLKGPNFHAFGFQVLVGRVWQAWRFSAVFGVGGDSSCIASLSTPPDFRKHPYAPHQRATCSTSGCRDPIKASKSLLPGHLSKHICFGPKSLITYIYIYICVLIYSQTILLF